MFVLTNTDGPSIDLSTCDSAAKFTIKSQYFGILLSILESQISPLINSNLSSFSGNIFLKSKSLGINL